MAIALLRHLRSDGAGVTWSGQQNKGALQAVLASTKRQNKGFEHGSLLNSL